MCIIIDVLCVTRGGWKGMDVTTRSTSNAYRLAYEKIRNQIFSGELLGGSKLIEERLAENIGVSRTPVREAIRRLEQEGLIKNKRVYKPTKEDLMHFSELRTLIESHSAKKAAESMSKEKLGLLRQAIKASKKGTLEEIVSANKTFHDLIVSECNNPVIIEEVQRMDAIFYLFSRTLIKNKRPLLFEEHEEIYQAIAGKNANLAEQLMRNHLQNDLKYMLRYTSHF